MKKYTNVVRPSINELSYTRGFPALYLFGSTLFAFFIEAVEYEKEHPEDTDVGSFAEITRMTLYACQN